MATLLESYSNRKNRFNEGTQTAMPGPEQVWQQQELLYRIGVIETCQMLVKTAPLSIDVKSLLWHYQIVDAYVQSLTQERRTRSEVSEDLQKQRNTAHINLLQVIKDYRKRFGSFVPGNEDSCYRKAIANTIQTVLTAWVQYRQTYINISKEATQ